MPSPIVFARHACPLRLALVPTGACIRGKIGPLELINKLQPPRAIVEHFESYGEQGIAGLAQRRPGLRLRQAASRLSLPSQNVSDRIGLEADGSFEVRDIPPGTWQLSLIYEIHGSVGEHLSGLEVLRSLKGLAEGEIRELEIDLSHLMPGELEGLVMLDGEPFGKTRVRLWGSKPDGKGGMTGVGSPQVETDTEGRFSATVFPGQYRVALQIAGRKRGQVHRVWSTRRHTIGPGDKLSAVFDVRRRVLRVRLVGSDGKTPIADRGLMVEDARGRHAGSGVPPPDKTDAEGWLVIDPAPAGKLRVHAWPIALATPEARTAWVKKMKREWRELQTMRVDLGTILVPHGEKEASFTLRMPEGAK